MTYGALISDRLRTALRRGSGNFGEYLYYCADAHKVYADRAAKHNDGNPLISFPIADYDAWYTTSSAIYVDVSDSKDELTYLPTNRLAAVLKDKHDVWTSPLRQSAKPGRVLRMLTAKDNPYLTDRAVEIAVNKITADFFAMRSLDYSLDFDIETMTSVYGDSRHASSCMSGTELRNRGYNHSNLGVAHLSKNGEVFARALAWKCVDGAVLLDRTYGTEASMKTLRAKARNAGHFHVSANGRSGSLIVAPDTSPIYRNFICGLDNDEWWSQGRYPYFDNMGYVSQTDLTVSLFPYEKTTHTTGFSEFRPDFGL